MAQRRRKRDQAFAETLGMNLARLRRAAGISQEELGFRADVHRTAVSMLERGEEIPGSDTLFKLSKSLGVSAGDLFEGLAWEPPGYNAGRVVVLDGGNAADDAPGEGER
jgi:transcriptional regulator with XRE-family HTH domain